jgi:hypothetical protein
MPAPWGLSVPRRLPKQALSCGPIAHLSVGVQFKLYRCDRPEWDESRSAASKGYGNPRVGDLA